MKPTLAEMDRLVAIEAGWELKSKREISWGIPRVRKVWVDPDRQRKEDHYEHPTFHNSLEWMADAEALFDSGAKHELLWDRWVCNLLNLCCDANDRKRPDVVPFMRGFAAHRMIARARPEVRLQAVCMTIWPEKFQGAGEFFAP